MNRRSPLDGRLLAGLAVLALCGTAAGVEMLSPSELKPGMKGYGLTVFSGQLPQRFGVEIIDVMPDICQRRNMILCRLSGMGLEQSGIIAGMSGSPVYVDERLIGAVAYGWNFSKEPIGGITPIGEMLEVWRAPSSDDNGSGARQLKLEGATASGLAPLSVPVALSGFSTGLLDIVGPSLEEHGLRPVGAAGNPGPSPSRVPLDSVLVPGGVVGIPLIQGDINLSAIGTITHREGDRLLAFGHPMFQAGSIEMPLSAGVIHTILPSTYSSFKVFSTTDVVGTMTQDRYPAVGGVVGPMPPMTPVVVSLESPTAETEYSFRTITHRSLTPLLVAVGIAEAVFSTEGMMEEMTLRSRTVATIDESTRVEVNHVYAGENPAESMFQNLVAELRSLVLHPEREPRLTKVEVALEFRPGRRLRRLLSIRSNRNRVRAGETATFTLELRDEKGTVSKEDWQVEIPASVPGGRLTVVATSRDSFMYRESMRVPGLSEPATLAGLFRLLERTGHEDELIIAGFLDVPGAVAGDRELPLLPPSLRAAIDGDRTATQVLTTSESLVLEKSRGMDGVVAGMVSTDLEVWR